MALFKNLTTEDLEESEDRLGGFSPIPSKIYKGVIKSFYSITSQGGATGIVLIFDLPELKREYRETIYITNKQGENFFKDKTSGKKMPLPGFTTVNDLCLIATSDEENPQELSEIDFEEKVVMAWDSTSKSEKHTKVQMATGLIGKEVALGVLEILENKSEKNERTGKYDPTAEERKTNSIDKVFHPEAKVTVAEARKELEPAFWDSWTKQNEGQVKDKRKFGKAGKGSDAGGPPTAAGSDASTGKSLFKKKK